MNFSWWTFALQAANFLILIWLLRRFLFKPVSAIVARREEAIARGLSEADQEKHTALQLQRELETQRAAIETERQQALDQQRSLVASERTRMLEEARAEANEIRAQARKKNAEEQEAFAEELFSRTLELAARLAERLLRELALPSIEQPFLGRVLDYLDRMPAHERDTLISHLGTDSVLVTTAHQLDAGGEEQWREQLAKRIGNSSTIAFHTDPALIAGAEITFPHAILRFSWRDSLAVAAKEIHRNEHSG